MKKLILSSLLAISVLSSGIYANEKYKKIFENAIPYNFKLGKTTCEEVKIKLPYMNKDDKYIKYGVEDKIGVFCNKKTKKIGKVGIYSNKLLRKLKVHRYIEFDQTIKVLRHYFQDNEIEIDYNHKYDGKYKSILVHFDDIQVDYRFFGDNGSLFIIAWYDDEPF